MLNDLSENYSNWRRWNPSRIRYWFFEPSLKYITTSEKLHDLTLISSQAVFYSPGRNNKYFSKSLDIPTDPMQVCNKIKRLKPKK